MQIPRFLFSNFSFYSKVFFCSAVAPYEVGILTELLSCLNTKVCFGSGFLMTGASSESVEAFGFRVLVMPSFANCACYASLCSLFLRCCMTLSNLSLYSYSLTSSIHF